MICFTINSCQLIHEGNNLAHEGGFNFCDLIEIRWWVGH